MGSVPPRNVVGGRTVPRGEGQQGRRDSGTPLVWVIVLNWNGAGVIRECLDSLLAMDYPNFKVMVVDNGSSDGSPKTIAVDYPQVELLEVGENLMYAGGNNAGMGKALSAGADALMLINNDTRADRAMLANLVRVLQANPAAAAVGPKIYYFDREDVIWSAGGRVRIPFGLIHHIGIRKPDSDRYCSVRPVDYLTGCCLLIRAVALDSIGMLDTSYVIYSEDVDWCLRAKAKGWKVLLAPDAHLWHKVSFSSGGGLTRFKAYYRMRSNVLIFRRFARPVHWLVWPLATAGWALALAAVHAPRGRISLSLAFLRGWAAGFAAPAKCRGSGAEV